MGAYISEFNNTWAVIYTNEQGRVVIEEFYTLAKAEIRLSQLR